MPTLFSAMAASASALGAERARIETAVSNMANAESTRGPNGEPYRRRDVVLAEDPVSAFDAMLGWNAGASGVKVAAIVQDREPFKQRYEPSHPDADANGFVSMPNVDTPQEMVDMLGAARAYQANLAAITTIREMVAKALELGR
jgi:flagellar basal-body rod protein FlgC